VYSDALSVAEALKGNRKCVAPNTD